MGTRSRGEGEGSWRKVVKRPGFSIIRQVVGDEAYNRMIRADIAESYRRKFLRVNTVSYHHKEKFLSLFFLVFFIVSVYEKLDVS